MFKDREKMLQAYHAMLNMALTWTIVLVINQYYELRVPIVLSAFLSFVPSFLIYLFDLNRKNIISYLLLAGILPLLALIFWINKQSPISWAQDLIEWCYSYNGTEKAYIASYANTIVFSSACIGAILLYIITKKQLAKVLLAIVIFLALLILSISKVDSNKAVVGICIFYIMTILVELYGKIISQKTGKQEKKEGILYLAPVCLLLAFFSIALPSKPEPIQWKVVKNVYHSVKEQLEIWKTEMDYFFGNINNEFSVSMTGYSENNSELKNDKDLMKDSKVALKIAGLNKNDTVYLIGSVSDIYTGSSWEKSHQDYLPGENDYLLDYSELIFALSRQKREDLENNRYVIRRLIEIEYNNIKTKTFFYPSKMSSFEIKSGKKKMNLEMPQINFAKAHGKGSAYENTYFDLNLEGEAFTRMLREADDFSYEDSYAIDMENANWIQRNLMFHYNDEDLLTRKDFYEILKERASVIHRQYTVLPEELPDRVRELALNITKDSETTYDKLKAIEAYLWNYTYSLEAQNIPENSDFADYFLFESKEGYCTSYATAMAVLGRCIGVPTRYVEGFLAKFQARDENFMYLVRNSQSHSWTEAYIEGVGWIPFEPTATFTGNRYTTWVEPAKAGASQSSGTTTSPYNYLGEEPDSYQNDVYVPIAKEDHSEEILNGLIIFLSVILVLLCIVIIYYLILRNNYKKAYEKADNSRKMYMKFLRVLRLLKREGFELAHQETILMLSNRVKDRFHYDRVTFADVANIFMKYRYAEAEVTQQELALITVFHEGLKNKEKEEASRFKVWLEELLFLAKKNY